MKNAECNLSEELKREVLKHFPYFLSDRDEELARRYFEQYVFFRTEGKSARWCVCTSCMEGFIAEKEIYPDFFKKHHQDKCECPHCGQAAQLLAMGKFQNFNSLKAHMRTVYLSKYDGGLMVQAGWITREFDDDDMRGTIDFYSHRRYYFNRETRAAWMNYSGVGIDGNIWTANNEWKFEKSIREPFQALPYYKEAEYALLGYEAIKETSIKYCQYAEWFQDHFGSYLGDMDDYDSPPYAAHLITYLAEYTRRPQLEFLAKFNFMSVITDLVIKRQPHGDILNWKAKTPPDFFRLSKSDFSELKQADPKLETIKTFRQMKKQGLIDTLKSFTEYGKRLSAVFSNLCECSLTAGVSLERAENYINSFKAGCHHGMVPLTTIVTCWKDYIAAAKILKYDLRRDDVRMPKDLNQKHDDATKAARITTDKEAIKAYQARYKKLVKQFELSDGKLSIVVPTSAAEIIEEGKALEHCVGGYAERHMTGKLSILFLRHTEFSSVSLVTIELTTEPNCEKLRVVQMHGYKNERDGSEAPRTKYKAFIDKWLDWVHTGSKRDKDGNPVIINKSEEAKIA